MKKNYTDVLLEDISDKFDAMLDGLKSVREIMARQKDLEEVKQDVKTIKLTVTATNRQVLDHEQRITHLESKV